MSVRCFKVMLILCTNIMQVWCFHETSSLKLFAIRIGMRRISKFSYKCDVLGLCLSCYGPYSYVISSKVRRILTARGREFGCFAILLPYSAPNIFEASPKRGFVSGFFEERKKIPRTPDFQKDEDPPPTC
ncbi:hypothetical protein VNO77_18891 [Canavalia gladiata]|uniref:Secreted protein n=1 Tax=Canavalia gladiata TaxID=3824 RepID=A0AAN9QKT2_CANGL